MARTNKVLQSHNLHNLFLEVEKLRDEGWTINRSVAVRRTLGNRYTVALVKGEDEVSSVEQSTEAVDQVLDVVDQEVKAEIEVETQAEPAKTRQRKKKDVTATDVEGTDTGSVDGVGE